MAKFNTAILFLVFNRPDVTKQVFESIRQAKPSRLYIAADGARSDKIGEKEKVLETRNYIINNINWKCEIKTLFRDKNLGCRNAVSSAIDWFFSHEEAGIIVEDDCVPENSFFIFCSEMLKKYKDDTRVGMISGSNHGFTRHDNGASYHFSKHGLIWGWATWRDSWETYHFNIDALSKNAIEAIKYRISSDNKRADYWWKNGKAVVDTWDFHWEVAQYMNSFMTVRPNKNLVANIGFGEDATHTKSNVNELYLQTESINFPLVHPEIMCTDQKSDNVIEHSRGRKPLIKRIINRIKRLIL